jgi:RimJ/RimL family protein N-acetyltransferase
MTDTISIAPFTSAQIDAVWQLRLRALHDHPQSFGQPWETAVLTTLDEVAALATTFWTGGDNDLFIATTQTGSPIGMLGIFREQRPRERHRMTIWGVYVQPEYRGLGISTNLARAAIDYARTLNGVLQVHLTVWSANAPAIASYLRLGFKRWGTMPRAGIVNGEPIDCDEMVLMLDHPLPSPS